MKKILFLLLLCLSMGCHPSKVVFVYHVDDIIGAVLLGLLIAIVLVLLVAGKINQLVDRYFDWRDKKKDDGRK